MNCPKCGTLLPAGVTACPVCGAPLANAGGFSGYHTGGYQPQNNQPAYAQNGYGYGAAGPAAGAGNGYAQGYNGYPQGYQPVYGAYDDGAARENEFLKAIANLPRVVRGAFRDPGETLRGMMERSDRYTGGVIAGLSLILTFLAAILVTRGTVMSLLTGLSSLAGEPLAGDAASMSQGVNYIAGKMAASVGGIAALCQLLALVLPVAVALTYLCVVQKVRFSLLLASSLTAIVTLPSVAAALLCMVASLLSPYAGALMILLGLIASYTLLSALITWITGLPEQRLVPAKIAVIGAAEVLKLLFFWLVGGALATAALNTVSGLISSMGSLL